MSTLTESKMSQVV